MLTHRALHHIDIADAAANKAEQAIAELVEAVRQRDTDVTERTAPPMC
ncbi:hypothetical protein SAMN03159463_05979 [Mesorhizobium sp. NFR06]|nr:hypothetical protein SAMN03159463_05979 [Mesorhizobium sp. NFR06]